MPFKSIRLTCAVLVVMLALGCLMLPAHAMGEEEKEVKLSFITIIGIKRLLKAAENGKQVLDLPLISGEIDLPEMTTYERMEYTRNLMLRYKQKYLKKIGNPATFGSLDVTSQPPGAQVWISSYTPKGITPLKKDKVLSRRQRITVKKEGYYQQARMVTIAPDKPAKLDFTLKPIPFASLTLRVNPPETKVNIIGCPDEYTPGMKIAPGGYVVKFSHARLVEKWLYVPLEDSQVFERTVDLEGPTGELWVGANQPDCVVYLDGREMGRSSLGIRNLLPGLHKLQVWKSLIQPSFDGHLLKRINCLTEVFDAIAEYPEEIQQAALLAGIQGRSPGLG